METQRAKEERSSAWRWLAEGWKHISNRAANALTYFTPAHDEADAGVSMRWGLLAADVNERDDSYIVELEAPGLDKDAIDITVDEHQVLVTATKRYESERREGAMRISERAFGSFQRVIPLPTRVTADGAEATYRRGVLRLKIAKAAPPGARKIAIGKS
jgi:HSP20 family protein